jgi:hypothetical protein
VPFDAFGALYQFSFPAHFDAEYDWIEESQLLPFPMARLVAGFEKNTKMFLACLLVHHVWLKETLNANHVFLSFSYLHWSEQL